MTSPCTLWNIIQYYVKQDIVSPDTLVSSGITWSEYAGCIGIWKMLLQWCTDITVLALLKVSWQHIFTEEW